MRKAIISKDKKLENAILKQYKGVKELQHRNEQTKKIEAEKADILKYCLIFETALKHTPLSKKVLCKFLGITEQQCYNVLRMNIAYPKRKREKLIQYVANLLKNQTKVKEFDSSDNKQ